MLCLTINQGDDLSGAKLSPGIHTLTQATICCLLIFDEEEISDVETEAAFGGVQGDSGTCGAEGSVTSERQFHCLREKSDQTGDCHTAAQNRSVWSSISRLT
jgi:hypothetical protein